ncbi:hypothetical protein LCGC14_2632350, partial [marine sediment metagenome]
VEPAPSELAGAAAMEFFAGDLDHAASSTIGLVFVS